MTQENKELLLKDLCARVYYQIKVLYNGNVKEIQYVEPLYNEVKLLDTGNYTIDISDIKPYLRPLGSMTDEEREEYRKFSYYGAAGVRPYTHGDFVAVPSFEKMDWLNSHYFDYRGLIPKGLALPAPEGMYNFKAE